MTNEYLSAMAGVCPPLLEPWVDGEESAPSDGGVACGPMSALDAAYLACGRNRETGEVLCDTPLPDCRRCLALMAEARGPERTLALLVYGDRSLDSEVAA